MKNLKLGSLFDGIGGFPLSASRHGITPVWASEIEPSCISITRRHFPQMKHLGDLTQINGADIEPVDIITFGSPCQDLSVAGKRAGLAGARSGLFGEAIRIIEEMREATHGLYPIWAVWENVPGALSSNDGLDFRAVLQSFTNTEIPMPPAGRWAGAGMVRGGRCDIGWRILDAQFWGVPQRRRRIFLVADFGGRRVEQILFKPESLRGNFAESGASGKRTAGGVGDGIAAAGFDVQQITSTTNRSNVVFDAPQPTLCKNGRPHVITDGASGTDYLTGWDVQSRRVISTNGVCPTLAGSDGGGGRNPGGYILTPPVAHALKAKGGLDHREDGDTLIFAGFNGRAAATAGSIGYQEEVSPTVQSVVCGIQPPCVVAFAANQRDELRDLRDVAGAVQAQPGMKQQTFIIQNTTNGRTGDNGAESCGVLAFGGGNTSGAINVATNVRMDFDSETFIIGGQIVRRLTPTECERLQGFPDGWTAYGATGKAIADTKRYAAIGNSVAIPCVDYLMSGIVEAANM